MTRQQANLKLLDALKQYFLDYPDMRFGQALSNLGIATHRLISHASTERTTNLHYMDIFFEEPEKTMLMLGMEIPKNEDTPSTEGEVPTALATNESNTQLRLLQQRLCKNICNRTTQVLQNMRNGRNTIPYG